MIGHGKVITSAFVATMELVASGKNEFIGWYLMKEPEKKEEWLVWREIASFQFAKRHTVGKHISVLNSQITQWKLNS